MADKMNWLYANPLPGMPRLKLLPARGLIYVAHASGTQMRSDLVVCDLGADHFGDFRTDRR